MIVHWTWGTAYNSRLLPWILSALELLVGLELSLRLPLIAILSLLTLWLLMVACRSRRVVCAGIVARCIL
jgi:hypothetical protein